MTLQTTEPGLEASRRPTTDSARFCNRLELGTNYTDIAGNTGTDNTESSLYVVDTKAPSVSYLQLTDGVTTTHNNKYDHEQTHPYCLPITGNIKVTFDHTMDAE